MCIAGILLAFLLGVFVGVVIMCLNQIQKK